MINTYHSLNLSLSGNMSVDLNAELAALRHLALNSKDDLARYRAAHSDDCFSTVMGPVAISFGQAHRLASMR